MREEFVCVVLGDKVERLRAVPSADPEGLPRDPAAVQALLAAVVGSGASWAVVPPGEAGATLYLDARGVPALVQLLEEGDTARLAVSEALATVASLASTESAAAMEQRFAAAAVEAGGTPAEALAAALGPGQGAAGYWAKVGRNLAEGRVRVVYLARSLAPEIRRLVAFLADQAAPAEFAAVEVRVYKSDDAVCYVPRLTGRRLEAAPVAARAAAGWDESVFFSELERTCGAESAGVARRLLAWAREQATGVKWGTVARKGCFIPEFEHEGASHQFFGVWTDGALQLRLEVMKRRPVFEDDVRREEFVRLVNDLLGTEISADERLPRIPLSRLADDEILRGFLSVQDWALHEVRAGNGDDARSASLPPIARGRP